MALPLKEKILFATGGVGENVVFQAATAWIFFFWAGQGDPQKALIPIGLLGVLIGVGRLIEAFDDPLIGYLSDITKSRWGRRFPYIFFGAPLLTLSFFLLWLPIPNAIYFFLALQFFFLMYTIVSAPYEGILPEIAKTSADRVSTSAWRVLFGVIGASIGLVGSSLIIQKFGFQIMGIALGGVALISFWIAILGIRKNFDKNRRPSNFGNSLNLHQALFETLKNRQFLIFSLAFVLFSLGLNLLTTLLPFYTKIILDVSEGWVSLFTGFVLVSMLLALPIQTRLSQKFGKKRVYAYSMLVLAIIFPFLFTVSLVPINPFNHLAILTIFIGLALSGQFIYPNAILADVIDLDETRTGLRREAIYYGMQNTLQKFSFALSSVIFGTTLAVFGATAENPLGIRLIGPIAGLTAFIGFVIFLKGYKLPEHIKNTKLST